MDNRPSLSLIAFAALLVLACGDVAVLHDLPETEANRVLSVLQQHGLTAEKELDDAENNTWTVTVPEQVTGRAFAILAEYKLPRRGDRRFRDVFGQSKLVITPLEEQALYIEALQGEIAHTLEAVDGVIDARVHLVLPKTDLSGRPMGQPKASVVLEFQSNPGGEEPLAEDQVSAIVAHAVGDLEPADVSVVRKTTAITASVAGTASGLDIVSVGSLIFERQTLVRVRAAAAAVMLFIGLLGGVILWQGHQLFMLRASADEIARSAKRQPRALPASRSEAA